LLSDSLGLSDEERALLASSLDDLVKPTPRTPVAVQQFKRLATTLGPGTANALKSVLVNVVSEYAKQNLWPD